MRYAVQRISYLVVILVAVTFLVSAMLSLMPGDPALAILGESATPQQIAAVHHSLHLDQTLLHRYFSWLADALHGNLGISVTSGDVPVWTLIRQHLPVTIELIILGQVLAVSFAVPTAIYSAHKPGKVVDSASGATAFGLISIPPFVLALFLILIFGVHLRWLPTAGFTPLSEDLEQNLKSMALPAITVAAHASGVYQRLLRSDMRATLREDYIAMAEAKGLSTPRILLRHGLRPSLFGLTTLLGLTTAQMIGGTVVVEVIFGLPGLGQLMINSIQLRDVVVVQGIVCVIAVVYVAMNAIVDLAYGVIDPRVRRVHN